MGASPWYISLVDHGSDGLADEPHLGGEQRLDLFWFMFGIIGLTGASPASARSCRRRHGDYPVEHRRRAGVDVRMFVCATVERSKRT